MNNTTFLIMIIVCGLILCSFLTVPMLYSCCEPSLQEQRISKQRITGKQNTADIVVTMTTLPHRVDTVLPSTLHSLRVQTVLPRTIEVNIPHSTKDGVPYTIPEWLRAEEQAGRINIFRVIDKGPATKYIDTLYRYEDKPYQRILVVDDDMIIHKNRIQEFDEASRKYPNDVLAAHGLVIDNGVINWLSYVQPFNDFKTFVLPKASRTKEQPIDIVCGFQNFLIQPRFFDMARLTDYRNMPKEAFWVDDVVISGHLAERGIIRRVPKNITGFNYLTTKHFWSHIYAFARNKRDHRNLSTGPNAGDQTNNIMINFFKNVW